MALKLKKQNAWNSGREEIPIKKALVPRREMIKNCQDVKIYQNPTDERGFCQQK